jgi:hypothetical protein
VRRCVGDPPRQIEDPQSPPCVPYWKGDNGGATHQGVTRDTIKIKIPLYDGLQNPGLHEALENFFNRRFEFYGRKLVLEQGEPQSGPSPENQRADAAHADEVEKVFASTTGGAGAYFYHQELARRKVLSVPVLSTSFSSTELLRLSPYIWEYQMATDRQLDVLGTWACRRLNGRNANHAGAQYQSSRRVFGGIMDHIFDDDTINLKPLKAALARCGAKLAAEYEFTSGDALANPDRTAPANADATNAVLKMKSANVTTVFCICVFTQFAGMARAATAQAYFPEWTSTSYHFMDYNLAMQQFAANTAEQFDHRFGISFNPKQLPPDQAPLVWAAREGDPNYEFRDYNTSFGFALFMYRELLALASGIQMAGPKLTPQTFAAGLQKTKFPNPQTPLMAGEVGFAGDREMTDDFAEIWWSTSAPNPYGGVGAYCYVAGGRRLRKEHIGTDDPLFKPPCDSGASR